MTDRRIDMAHSELRALVTKAARGAGLAWGLADEAGWAADWLARRSLPAGDWAAIWLAARLDGKQSPVEYGTSLADRLATGPAPLQEEPLPDALPAPGYLLPFLHRIAVHQGPCALIDDRATVAAIEPDGQITFGPSWSDRPHNWRLTPLLPKPNPSRTSLTASLVDCLEGLALQTTVPPSPASRQNAGADGSDND